MNGKAKGLGLGLASDKVNGNGLNISPKKQ